MQRQRGRDREDTERDTDTERDRATERQRETERDIDTHRVYHYFTRIKILGSCPFLQSVPAALHANRLKQSNNKDYHSNNDVHSDGLNPRQNAMRNRREDDDYGEKYGSDI